MDIGYKVGQLEEAVKSVREDVAEIKAGMLEQNKQLDLLVANLNKQKGAKAILFTLFSTGFLGWIWEHFHK
jgi:hypothetical protein